MSSPTKMHDGGKDSVCPQDVFCTPPEESSLPSSDDHLPPVAASDVDLCAVSQDVDVGTQGSVIECLNSDVAEFHDSGKDSELGFDSEMVAEIEGDDACGDDSEYDGDEIRVSESESSDLGFSEGLSVDAEKVAEFEGDCVPDQDFECNVDEIRVSKREPPVKKLKLSEQDSGFGSSVEFLGAELKKTEEGVANCKGKLVSDAYTDTESTCDFGENLEPQENVPEPQNLVSGENLETQEIAQTENKENAGAEKFPNPSDEVVEASGTMEINDIQLNKLLIRNMAEFMKNLVSEKKGVKVEDTLTYKVVKYILEKYDENNLHKINYLEVMERSGVEVTFPCPRWWPENYEELNYNTAGLKIVRDWEID